MTQILEELNQVVTQPQMNEDSALVLNAGVHLLKSTTFKNYQKIIRGFIKLLKDNYHGKAVWKTIPSLGRQTELYTGCCRRFHTEQVMTVSFSRCEVAQSMEISSFEELKLKTLAPLRLLLLMLFIFDLITLSFLLSGRLAFSLRSFLERSNLILLSYSCCLALMFIDSLHFRELNCSTLTQ